MRSRKLPRLGFSLTTPGFSRPGKRTNNAHVESSNGRFREDCLNMNWFLSLEGARVKIEAWRLQ